MTNNRTRCTRSELIFLIIWTFYSSYGFILGSELHYDYYDIISPLMTICKYVTILVLLFAFFGIVYFNKVWDTSKLIEYAIFLLVIFIVELKITDTTLLLYVLFIMLAQVIDFDRLISFDVKLKIILLAIILGMCALGIVENISGDYQSGFKQAFGFANPNTFACYILTILVEWLCLRYKKMKWYDWMGVGAFTMVVIYLSNARSSIYTFIGIFLLFFLANLIPQIFYSKIAKICFACVTPFIAVFSFFVVYLYGEGNSFATALDSLLSGRIRLAYHAVHETGMSLFGQEIEFSSRMNPFNNETRFLVDIAYVHIALRYGIIILILLVFMYSYLFIKLIDLKRIDIALLGLFFVILGFGETYMYNISYNLSMLCILGVSNAMLPKDRNGSQLENSG